MAARADCDRNLQTPPGLSGLGVPDSPAWAQEHQVLPLQTTKCPALVGKVQNQ